MQQLEKHLLYPEEHEMLQKELAQLPTVKVEGTNGRTKLFQFEQDDTIKQLTTRLFTNNELPLADVGVGGMFFAEAYNPNFKVKDLVSKFGHITIEADITSLDFASSFSKPDPLKMRKFKTEWQDHDSSSGLFSLYRCLKGPYKFLEHAISCLEYHLLATLSNFFLIERGSYKRRVALKHKHDIDLDLVIPRCIMTKETLANSFTTNEQGEIIGDITLLANFCASLYTNLNKRDSQISPRNDTSGKYN